MNEPKHPLATLRRLICLKQKEMADLIGCSLPTVQAIEYGKLKLSDKLATLISQKTGVDSFSLRAGLAAASLVGLRDHDGKPYTRKTYEHHQALLFAPAQDSIGVQTDLALARSCFHHAIERLAILFTKALREKAVIMCNYKVGCATEEVLAESGTYKTLSEEERHRWLNVTMAREPKKLSGYGERYMMEFQCEQITGSVGGQELIGVIERFIKETDAVFHRQLEHLKPTPHARQHSASAQNPPQRPSSPGQAKELHFPQGSRKPTGRP